MLRTQLRFIIARRPQVLYLRMHFAAVGAVLWAWMAGVPIVVEVNGPFEDLFIAWPMTRKIAPLFRALMRLQLKTAQRVVTVTDELGAYVTAMVGRCDAVTIANGANVDVFHPKAKTSLNLPERFVVVFGTLAPWQGIGTILDATTLNEWPEDVACVVVGDGQMRAQVERAARRPERRVRYLGKVPATELAGVIARSSAGLVVCEDVQGRARTGLFPLKLFETMACGVPVIASDFPGMADLVRETGCGKIVAERAPLQVAKGVAGLCADRERAKAMGRAGLTAVRAAHSWEHRAIETRRVLEEATSG